MSIAELHVRRSTILVSLLSFRFRLITVLTVSTQQVEVTQPETKCCTEEDEIVTGTEWQNVLKHLVAVKMQPGSMTTKTKRNTAVAMKTNWRRSTMEEIGVFHNHPEDKREKGQDDLCTYSRQGDHSPWRTVEVSHGKTCCK